MQNSQSKKPDKSSYAFVVDTIRIMTRTLVSVALTKKKAILTRKKTAQITFGAVYFWIRQSVLNVSRIWNSKPTYFKIPLVQWPFDKWLIKAKPGKFNRLINEVSDIIWAKIFRGQFAKWTWSRTNSRLNSKPSSIANLLFWSLSLFSSDVCVSDSRMF